MSVLEIDLSKYGNLESYYQSDRKKLAAMLPEFLKLADWYLEAGGDSQNVFGMPLYKFIELQIETFFDWKGPLKHHHSNAEAKALEILEEENHPLQVFKGKSPAYDAEGNRLALGEYTTAEDIQDFIQSILYALRFGSQKDLVNYMLMKEYDLVDQLKANNVQQLLKVQPALEYQKHQNIPIGKRIPRSGFFECGELVSDNCAACQSDSLVSFGDFTVCRTCKAGYRG